MGPRDVRNPIVEEAKSDVANVGRFLGRLFGGEVSLDELDGEAPREAPRDPPERGAIDAHAEVCPECQGFGFAPNAHDYGMHACPRGCRPKPKGSPR